MQDFRAAVCQTNAIDDQDANLGSAAELVARAVGDGAQLVILPERFALYGPQKDIVFEAADGPSMSWLSEQASKHGVYLGGGVTLAGAEGGRGTNTFALFDPQGNLAARYDKIHLFKVVMDEVAVDETLSYDRGSEPVVAETALGRIGLTICYDLRFPELYRKLRELEADVVIVPAAFTVPTGRAHWATLLRARAIENQLYVMAAGQGGDHNQITPPSYGHSAIYDPWGEPLAELDHDRPDVAIASLSPARRDEVRARIPCWSHRVM